MELTETGIAGLVIISPKVFYDDRGYFFESYQKKALRKLGIDVDFMQDNESCSAKGILRGLHFQSPPYAQGKLVRVVKGAVLDVAVDIRKKSQTYGEWRAFKLDGNSKQMIWVPEGFAHGFLVLEDDTVFQYKCTNYYNKEAEGSIRWDDPTLNIGWEISDPTLSAKDLRAPLFHELTSPF
jgi:dTDP-4-dehydrorhamnose 3,5-epimerase